LTIPSKIFQIFKKVKRGCPAIKKNNNNFNSISYERSPINRHQVCIENLRIKGGIFPNSLQLRDGSKTQEQGIPGFNEGKCS
jgi:hypothetical protein